MSRTSSRLANETMVQTTICADAPGDLLEQQVGQGEVAEVRCSGPRAVAGSSGVTGGARASSSPQRGHSPSAGHAPGSA